MKDLKGKTAFITGGASGIGLGMARAFLAAGMKVALTDIREAELKKAADAPGNPADLATFVLDVTHRNAWEPTAEAAERALGPVSLLCSNAGVNVIGSTQAATYEDWDFLLGVNLGGAISATHTFVPRMLARGGEAHVVITSSVSGLYGGRGAGVYTTTKFALTGLGESLRADLAPHGIGVSLLCPGPVQSELFESTTAVRPARLADTGSVPVVPPGTDREKTPIFETALTFDEAGRRVVEGVKRNDLYIMTHSEIRPVLEARVRAQVAALPDETVPPERIAASKGLLEHSLYDEQIAKPAPKPL